MLRRLALVVLLVSSALALLAFGLLNGVPDAAARAGGLRHWAFAPVLAFVIVLSMGCLVAFAAAGAGGRRR